MMVNCALTSEYAVFVFDTSGLCPGVVHSFKVVLQFQITAIYSIKRLLLRFIPLDLRIYDSNIWLLKTSEKKRSIPPAVCGTDSFPDG
jgi:hypothetical protein